LVTCARRQFDCTLISISITSDSPARPCSTLLLTSSDVSSISAASSWDGSQAVVSCSQLRTRSGACGPPKVRSVRALRQSAGGFRPVAEVA
jgi:hypothetical protein